MNNIVRILFFIVKKHQIWSKNCFFALCQNQEWGPFTFKWGNIFAGICTLVLSLWHGSTKNCQHTFHSTKILTDFYSQIVLSMYRISMIYNLPTKLFFITANIFWGILALSSQIEGSLLRTPSQQSGPEQWYFLHLQMYLLSVI